MTLWINTLRAGDDVLVQIIVWKQYDAKLLLKPMLIIGQLDL